MEYVIIVSSDTNRFRRFLPDLRPGRSQTIRAFENRGTGHADQGDFDTLVPNHTTAFSLLISDRLLKLEADGSRKYSNLHMKTRS